MKGLVSFTLFGDDPRNIYYGGALKNAELYSEYYPDWQIRFYLGDSVPLGIYSKLEQLGAEVVRKIGEPEDQTATGWRFLSLREPGWDFYLFRDCDSRPITRERVAVGEWLASGLQFHTMRDHPYHNIPMLAGLWGCTDEGAKKIQKLVPDRLVGDYYQVDQEFLSNKVWRRARRSVMIHKYDARPSYMTRRREFPFTVPRQGLEFVGEGLFADDSPIRPDHREMLRV